MEKLIVPSILSVSDVVTMTDRILKIVQKLIGNDAKLNGLYNKLNQIFIRLVRNQKNSSKSLLTEELNMLDKQRDRAFIALRDILHGMSVSLPENISSKASVLYSSIEMFGIHAYKLGYKAETAILISIFADFDQDSKTQLLKDLEILAFYESLKTAQEAFIDASTQKSDEKTLRTAETEAATDILNEIFPALTSQVAMIQLYSQEEPEIYSDSYNQILTSIIEINTTARARQTRKQNEADASKLSQKAN